MRDDRGERRRLLAYAQLREHRAAVSRAEWRRRCRAHTSIARALIVALGVLGVGYGSLELAFSALLLMQVQGPQGFALLPALIRTLPDLLLVGGTSLGLLFAWDRLAIRGGRRRAALTMGRCASCGYPLAVRAADSVSKHSTCSECGATWNTAVDAVTRFRHVGWVTDHRKDLHRFRYEAPRPLPFLNKRNLWPALLGSGCCAVAGGLLIVAMVRTRSLDEIAPQLRGWHETLLLAGFVLGFFLLITLAVLPVGTNAARRARLTQGDEVLAAGKCPVCSEVLPTAAGEGDGCTVCTKCAAAWRVPARADACGSA